MIGLDTNMLVRLLTQDDKRQAQLVDRALEATEASYINHVVLCELVWVLANCYRHRKSQLISVLELLIANDSFVFEEQQLVEEAFELFKAQPADFADILVGLKNKKHHCDTTLTLDKTAAKSTLFTLLH